MNCHHRAAWTSRGAPTPSYEARPGPGALAIFAQTDPIFFGLLGVDSLWSISDRATGPAASGQASAPAR
jgi:hypothetical protein